MKYCILDDGQSEAIGLSKNLPQYVDAYPAAITAVRNQSLYMRRLKQLAQAGFVLPVLIHPSATVFPSAEVNYGTVVCAQAIIGAGANIGRGCIISSGAAVDQDVISGWY